MDTSRHPGQVVPVGSFSVERSPPSGDALAFPDGVTMRFHFATINHNGPGKETLGDMCDWFSAGLLDLGHTTSRGDYLDTGAMNVMWDNFRPGMGAILRAAGVRYGIVATELPDGEGGFNWRRDPPWPDRYAAFPEVAAGAGFIWSMIESACPHHDRFAPCAFMELGYSARLLPPRSIRSIAPDTDFGTYGLRTPYREQVVAALGARGLRVAWPDRLPDTAAIQRFIATTRRGLNFLQSERWPIPSPTRLGRYLLGQRLLVSQRTPVPTRQGGLIRMAPADVDFVDWCLEAASADWKTEANAAFERYRATMPMAAIMERALDTTLRPPRRSWSFRFARRLTPEGLTVEPAPGDAEPRPPGRGLFRRRTKRAESATRVCR